MRCIVGLALCCATGAASSQEVVFADGFEDCSMMDLGDGDRLVGCRELVLGTDPLVVDTDGDGLTDGDEALGTVAGLPLPAFGTKPARKTILLEIDWIDDALQCVEGQHSHRPDPAAVEAARRMFADADVPNPDGSRGIDLVVDYGQGGVFVGGAAIAGTSGVVDRIGPQYYAIRNPNFAANRRDLFHYQLWTHRLYALTEESSGWAEVGGNDGTVTLYCLRDVSNQAHALVHELGHNLGLKHGGDSACKYEPNYNSMMNYRFEFYGVDRDCDTRPDGASELDFSYGGNRSIDEHGVDEAAGVCPAGSAKPVDFDADGIVLDAVYTKNLNPYDAELAECGSELSVLTDHADWQSLRLADVADDAGGANPPQPSAACPSPPEVP